MKALTVNSVFVGLPKEKVGGKVYGDGLSVIAVGAMHEYGFGNNPQRSFLRVPFKTKQKELSSKIAKQFELVANGLDPVIGLNRIGAIATNISKGAFVTMGYGTWTPITEKTARRKGSTRTLIDNGVLRGSITWVVR